MRVAVALHHHGYTRPQGAGQQFRRCEARTPAPVLSRHVADDIAPANLDIELQTFGLMDIHHVKFMMIYRKKYDHPIHLDFDEMWIPDAFIGPMASLMEAIDKDEVPLTSTRDNLNTLRIVEAAYLSVEENRSVRPEEIG